MAVCTPWALPWSFCRKACRDGLLSETRNPFTASLGQVAYQFTTPTLPPWSESTFQRALTCRWRAVIGSSRSRPARRRSATSGTTPRPAGSSGSLLKRWIPGWKPGREISVKS